MSFISVVFLASVAIVSSTAPDSDGYTPIKKLNAKYKFHGPSYDLHQGIAKCLSEKSEFYYLKGIEEAKIVYEAMVPKNVEKVLLGVYKPKGSKSYKTIHGDKSVYMDLNSQNDRENVVLYSNMTYQEEYVTQEYYFLCEKRRDCLTEEDGEQSYQNTLNPFDATYEYITGIRSWNDMVIECLRYDSELFYPLSMDEGRFVFENIVPKKVDQINVGIHNWFTNSRYTTIDGSSDFIHEWKDGEPKNDTDCIVVLERSLRFSTTTFYGGDFVCVKRRTPALPTYCQSIDGDRDSAKLHQFHNEPVSWFEAVRICDARNTTLAMPESQTEVSRISDYFNSVCCRLRGTWLGFHNALQPDEFSDISDVPVKRNKYKWKDSWHYKSGCGSVTTTGFLTVQNCSSKMPYLCQSDIDFKYYPKMNKWYKFSWTSLSWYKARKFCQKAESMLAMPMNINQVDMLLGAMKFEESIHIGFHSHIFSDENTILKNLKPIPDKLIWKNRIKDETKLCGALDKYGIYKVDCNVKHYFFCEKDNI